MPKHENIEFLLIFTTIASFCIGPLLVRTWRDETRPLLIKSVDHFHILSWFVGSDIAPFTTRLGQGKHLHQNRVREIGAHRSTDSLLLIRFTPLLDKKEVADFLPRSPVNLQR
jgi:hypothetical protein